MNEITDYITDGEDPKVLYAMVEEDDKRLKFFFENVFQIEMAMNRKAKDLIKGIPLHRGVLKNATTTTQRLVKVNIESVEYLEEE